MCLPKENIAPLRSLYDLSESSSINIRYLRDHQSRPSNATHCLPVTRLTLISHSAIFRLAFNLNLVGSHNRKWNLVTRQ